MFKFIHAADIHLDSPLQGLERYDGAPVDEIRGATRKATQNLVQLAIQEKVAFVLIAGDLYDGNWACFKTGQFFISQMGRLNEAGVRVFLIAGNHDAENRNTKQLKWPANVRMLNHARAESVAVDDFGVIIHGQSFATKAVTDNLAAAYPLGDRAAFNIGMLHTCAAGNSDHERYAPCSLDDLMSREYQYWALGHVHNRADLHSKGAAPIAFAGNLQGRHIRETGAKGCYLVTIDGGRVATEFKPLDVFRWTICEIDAAGAADADDVVPLVERQIAKALADSEGRPLAVRVRIRGASRAHSALNAQPLRWINEIRAAATVANSGQVWIEKVRFDTTSHAQAEAVGEGPLAELAALFDELRNDPEALQPFARDLMDLRQKLPSELREGADALLLEEDGEMVERLRRLLPGAEAMLAARLGGAS